MEAVGKLANIIHPSNRVVRADKESNRDLRMTFEMLILQLMVDHFIKLLYFTVECALTPWELAGSVTRISVERHLLLVI